jgi:hypothetical protein
MKWLILTTFILLNSKLSLAQQPQILRGKVSIDRDSTDWVATVIEKDTVSVLFRMQFESIAPEALPQNGVYQIVYSPNAIEFNDVKKKKSYAFALSNSTISPKKGLQFWPVIGIGKMNPVCLPTKK